MQSCKKILFQSFCHNSMFNRMATWRLFVIICEICKQFLPENCFKINPTPTPLDRPCKTLDIKKSLHYSHGLVIDKNKPFKTSVWRKLC